MPIKYLGRIILNIILLSMTDRLVLFFLEHKYLFLFFFCCLFIASYYWKFFCSFFKFAVYKNIQRVHHDEVSRFGGFFIFLFLFFLSFYNHQSSIFYNLIISSFPFILVTFFEDIFQICHQK